MKKTLGIVFIVIAIILLGVIGFSYLKPKNNTSESVDSKSGDITQGLINNESGDLIPVFANNEKKDLVSSDYVSFDGVIKSIGDKSIVVEPVQGFKEANVSNEIIVSTTEIMNMISDLKVGDTIKINYVGEINEKDGVFEITK